MRTFGSLKVPEGLRKHVSPAGREGFLVLAIPLVQALTERQMDEQFKGHSAAKGIDKPRHYKKVQVKQPLGEDLSPQAQPFEVRP